MCRRMADAGADALLIVTPFYYKGGMTNAALSQHFKQVADQSPVPIILYSVPGSLLSLVGAGWLRSRGTGSGTGRDGFFQTIFEKKPVLQTF